MEQSGTEEAERHRRVEDFHAALMAGDRGVPTNDAYELLEDWAGCGLTEAVESFRRGVHRVGQMSGMLMDVAWHMCTCQYVADVVRLQKTGTLYIPSRVLDESGVLPASLVEDFKVAEEARATLFAIRAGKARVDFQADLVSSQIIAAMVAGWNDEMRTNSLRSFYESIVVLSWSTFETVAEDLWEAAVNARPGKLASGKIDVNDLKRERFDVRNKLGTLLKHVDNRSFRSLWDIQDAYEQTFTDQGTRIKELLSDPELQYSAAVRNVIIHKGGRIDGEYLKQVASVPAAFRGEPGEQFPLTGKITHDRSEVALNTAAKLLKAVCGWIVGHPEK